MNEHFIKNIEIRNFKCFNSFKVDGLKRVNLIGGKNNVGKTAFMEACYLQTSKDVSSIYNKLLEINTHRDAINQLLDTKYRKDNIRDLILKNKYLSILSNFNNIYIFEKNGILTIHTFKKKSEYNLSDLITFLDVNIYNTKIKNSISFISQNSNDNHHLNTIIDNAKLENKLNLLNKHLQEIFNIEGIDTIKYKPYIKVDNKYKELSQFGQGIKTFINIISSMLLLNNNDIIFIDEIENGIHYSILDRFWELILTISKQQNIQLFATTHSKECIESYAKVAKKLEDEEITFIELGQNKYNKLDSTVMDSEMFQRFIKLGNEVRGW